MTIPGGDRIKELSNTSGTGSFVLTGAVAGEPVRAFSSSEDGQYIRYVAKHVTAQEAESGFGVYTHATRTLTRLYRYYPTRGGSAVSFSSGGVHVACTAIIGDLVPNFATSNPTVNDDINAGYLAGMEWINTSTGAAFKCISHAAGAADWDQINAAAGTVPSIDQWDVAARLAAGSGDYSGVAAGDLTEETTPAAGHFLLGWSGTALRKFDVGDLPTGTGDVAPTQVVSDAATYTLTTGSQLHTNSEVRSHQASVDFEVPVATGAGRKWLIKAIHDSCTVSVVGNAGSVNGVSGGSAILINGGVAIIEVDSNAGSAPVVLVRGDVLVPMTDVGGAKTYDNDDSGQNFRLTSTTTQTFGAAASYGPSFYVNLFKETTGNVTLDGADADYTLQPTATDPAVVTVMKVGTALIAFGSDGKKILDAA